MRHTIVYLDDGGIYRAIDKHGHSIDSLLTSHRGEQIAPDFLVKALRRYGVPKAITINPSEVTSAAIWGYNEAHGMAIIIRQVKYRNNIVEQDDRGMKQVTCPLSEFKSFEASQPTLVGIELRHTPKKGQVGGENGTEGFTPAEQVYSLAASSPAQ